MIEAPKYSVTHDDRHLACQEAVDGPLQEILDQATTHGWGTIETISAMEEVLKHLRIRYEEDPDPAEDPTPAGSGDANDFGAFPSAERLIKAFVDERGKP